MFVIIKSRACCCLGLVDFGKTKKLFKRKATKIPMPYAIVTAQEKENQ